MMGCNEVERSGRDCRRLTVFHFCAGSDSIGTMVFESWADLTWYAQRVLATAMVDPTPVSVSGP
jgi:hypothetical protein